MESTGHSKNNPRLYELVEHAPKTGPSPTVWAWPQIIDWLKIAGQPVSGPWPPDQKPRPDPEADAMPVAVAEPEPTAPPGPGPATSPGPGTEDGPAAPATTSVPPQAVARDWPELPKD